ncbi:MAG: DUF3187 family protein [Steroidobacteraceae bacterium]
MRRTRLVLLALLWMVVGAAWADASPGIDATEEFYGPLRARDLSPFGYLRLDMRPPFAGNTAPGTWTIESEFAYQNTWAISPTASYYLELQRRPRRSLTVADLDAMRAWSPENYLVDLELAQFDVALHRQLSADWGAFVVLSGVNYGGGLLDDPIEQFHQAFGLSNSGRRTVRQGQINMFFDLKGQQYTALDATSRSGLLDPTIGVRYTGIPLRPPWQLVLEAETKIPLNGERAWLSAGRVDAGLQATLVRSSGRHALYGNVALVRYAGSEGSLPTDARLLPALVAGYELRLTSRTHSIVQFYASPSVYSGEQTNLDELLATKYQLSLGLRHHRGKHLFTFAVTENIGSLQNTPDISLQFGWVYRSPRVD